MYTKEGQARNRAQRSAPNLRLEYTIDGPIHTKVVSSHSAELEKEIWKGDRALQMALQDMRREQTFNSRYGLAKAHFNHSNSNEEPQL